MTASATKAALQRRAVQLIELRRSRIEHQILCRTLGVIAARVGQRLEKSNLVGAHGLILCPLRHP